MNDQDVTEEVSEETAAKPPVFELIEIGALQPKYNKNTFTFFAIAHQTFKRGETHIVRVGVKPNFPENTRLVLAPEPHMLEAYGMDAAPDPMYDITPRDQIKVAIRATVHPFTLEPGDPIATGFLVQEVPLELEETVEEDQSGETTEEENDEHLENLRKQLLGMSDDEDVDEPDESDDGSEESA